MPSWKKKLGALVPGDARAHLRNAFTVDWSGHKTVLVDVQPTDREQDVELSPFGDHGGYGRLADDDGTDGNDAAFVKPRLGREASSSSFGGSGGSSRQSHSVSPLPYPEPPTHKYGEYANVLAKGRGRSMNPFADPFHHADDYVAAAGLLSDPLRKRSDQSSGDYVAAAPAVLPRTRPAIRTEDIWDELGSPTTSTASSTESATSAAPTRSGNKSAISDLRR